MNELTKIVKWGIVTSPREALFRKIVKKMDQVEARRNSVKEGLKNLRGSFSGNMPPPEFSDSSDDSDVRAYIILPGLHNVHILIFVLSDAVIIICEWNYDDDDDDDDDDDNGDE